MLNMYGCNWGHSRNDVSIDIDDTLIWFEDTGITVSNANSERAYRIVKDANDWLYYASSVDECLEPVRDADGNMTKDISIFENNK